jgi:hypothetical protein
MNSGRGAYIPYEQVSLRSSLLDTQTNLHFYNPAMYNHIHYA